MADREKPTQACLKELFDYDPETGLFQRKTEKRSHKNAEHRYGAHGAGRQTELGYVMVMVDGVNFNAGILAHIYVHGAPPAGKLRYLNGIKADNRIANLGVYSGEDGERLRTMPMTQDRLKELVTYVPETGCFYDKRTGLRIGTGHGQGYRAVGLDYKKFLEHRLAFLWMTGEWPVSEVDHINGNKSDNRWDNLREATRSQNNHNRGVRSDNTSGHPGVNRHGNKWRTRFQMRGKVYDGGTHDELETAIATYTRLKAEHGDT